MNFVVDRCTNCRTARPKGARWYWIDACAKPPIVYCPTCAETKAPGEIARRAEQQREIIARRRRRSDR